MFAAAAITILLLLLPGAATGVAAGLRPMPALAAAGPIIVGIAGFGAWAAGALGLDWGWPVFLAIWAGATAIAYLARQFVPGADPRSGALRSAGPGAHGHSPMRPTSAEWATAAVSAAVTLVGSVRYLLPLRDLPGGGSNLREAWDMHWHNNFLRWAVDEGIASPTRAGELMNRETAEEMFYPAAWHALGSLVPGDPILQGNVFGAVAPMVLLPAGAAFLAWVVAGNRWAVVAAPAAAVASIALPEITGSLMITASLPYLLAVAAIPATMALLITGRTVAVIPALMGVFLAHPAAAVALAVFALLWWLTRPRPGSFLRLLITAAVVAVLLAPILVSAAGSGDSVAEFHGQVGIDRAQSAWWTVTGQSNHTQKIGWYPPAVVLSLVGAVVLLLRRRPWTPWPVFGLVVLGVVADSAQARWADPFGEWLRILGTFFYDMAYRIQAPMGVLRLVCIGVAVAWLAELVLRAWSAVRHGRSRDDVPASPLPDVREDVPGTAGRRARRRRTAAATVAAAVASVALVPVSWATGDDARLTMTSSRGSTFVSDADKRAMEWLAEQPRAMEGHVLVNPSEGSGWMYALTGLPSLFTHFPWPDEDSEMSKDALNDLDLAGTGVPGDPNAVNDVDVALRKLGIRYVFVSPPSSGMAGGAALASRSWAWWTEGLTPVYRDGPTTIFAVDAMLPDAELDEVLEDSPHPPGRPDPAKMPRRQPIVAPAGEPVSPLSGAVIGVREGTGDVDELTRTDLDDAQRLAGDPELGRGEGRAERDVTESLADATIAELRRRGATVVELPDGADLPAETTGESTAGTGTGTGAGSGSATAPGTDADGTSSSGSFGSPGSGGFFDAVINVGVDAKGAGISGTRVTGLYEAANGFADTGTANLAAGIRDALVFHRFSPDNRYDDEGRPGYVIDGLAPAFRTPPTAGAPEVIVSAGNIENSSEAKALKTREWKARYARGIADGIASMLRQF